MLLQNPYMPANPDTEPRTTPAPPAGRAPVSRQEIDQCLAALSHDLKHPAISIHGLLSIIQEDAGESLDPATREFLITGHGIQLAASSASAEAVLGANVAADPAAQLVPAGRSKRRR